MKARKPPTRARRLLVLTVVALVLPALAIPGAAAQQGPPGDAEDHPVLQPIDAQDWVDQADLTWDDYTVVRPAEWESPLTSEGSDNQFEAAVILMDFEDQPFVVTQEEGAHPFGNPAPPGSPHAPWEPVDPDDVQDWFWEYYNVPNEFNGNQTIHSYWMETTHGRTGVDVDVFGPYTLDGKLHEFGLFAGPTGGRPSNPGHPESSCPAGDVCSSSVADGRDIRAAGNEPWRAEMEADGFDCPTATFRQVADCGYDFLLYVTAGHDESSTWEEQGRMLFQSVDDVPDAFGPPPDEDGNPAVNNAGNVIENWVKTRYLADVPIEDGGFTSWAAGINHWPNATGGSRPSSTQAESSGQSVFAHEISHLFGLPDNYNNPFADNVRNYTGYWEMMSRGTFNGPGGTHNRWQIPNQGGSALGPHHLLHFKNGMDAVAGDEQLFLDRNDLTDDGIAIVRLKARSAIPEGDLVGLTVQLGAGGYTPGACEAQGVDDPGFWCPPGTNWQAFTFEVVDRVGNDSFVPGHGVLLNQTRPFGFPQVWMIDPNPEDIGLIDYFRPDGEPVPVVRGDPRQLNNATFHAGTNSDSDFEYVDEFNDLHFYILDTHRDDDGALFYDVAVRNLQGAGDFDRGAALGEATITPQRQGHLASCTFPLTNSGEAGDGVFDSDVYRLDVSSSSEDWQVHVQNELAFAPAGGTVDVASHVLKVAEGDGSTTVTLTATSESDPDASATATCDVHVRDTTPGGGRP